MIGFALDMDGTVYHGERPIPGAREFINRLVDAKVPFRFVTNNSSHTRGFYADRLKRMGFNVTSEDVLTSTIATIRFIKTNRPGKTVFALATPDVCEEIRSSGITLVAPDEKPDIVLLAFDTTIDYRKINDAYQCVIGGSELIATHPDDVCPTEYGYDVDIGPFIRLFESLTKVPVTVVGKPNRLMLDMAALEMGVPADDVIMVGDRLSTDMRMAVDAGTRSILVLSGETDRALLDSSDIRPTYVKGSVAEIDLSELR
ncbi:MAG: HAD-IIA family hydrolase [archaeon]|nr:HAD-IIA family hydrolase [archaeon]